LHDQDPTSHSTPTKLINITREHYVLILSGRAADTEQYLSYLHPAFHNAFCKSNNISCWVKVGDVPCTRAALKNKNVQQEVGRGDTCVSIEGFDPFNKFAFRAESMLEVEDLNKRACAHLNHLGYNGDGFLIKARRQAHNLIQRVSSITTEEAGVTALSRLGIILSSIFFVVGPKCLSTDEIFKAMQYNKMLQAREQRIKERNCLLDENLKHDAGREAALKVAPKKPDHDAMLRWKMGADKYKSDAKGSRIDKLKLLWDQYKDVEPPSIVVPEEE
jgi:hypothetical protein